jgi:hypothetical protein
MKKPNQIQRLVYRMMTENTGRHLLDSGGIYGRNWERNQKLSIKDFMSMPLETLTYDVRQDYFERVVYVFPWLCHTYELDDICDKFNRRNNKCKDWDGEVYGTSKRAYDWLMKTYDLEFVRNYNTYNGESDLSQVLQGTELLIDGETYHLIQVHGGCDVRGGYTDAKLFKVPYYQDHVYEWMSQTELRELYDEYPESFGLVGETEEEETA